MPKIYVDFYDFAQIPGAPWSYNGFNTFTVGQLSASLNDDTNTPTGVSLDIIGADFNGRLGSAGTSVGATVWPDDVHNYGFYTNDGATALQFGNVPVGATFTLELAGQAAQPERDTNYTVTPANEGQQLYNSTGSGNPASNPVVFTGTVGGDGLITVNMALVSAFAYIDGMTLDYVEGGGGTKQASVRLADLNGNDRANVASVPWRWYDSLPQIGVGPTDTGTGATDGTGNMTVDIPNSTLTAGQVGYLLIDTGAWQSIHAVTVTET